MGNLEQAQRMNTGVRVEKTTGGAREKTTATEAREESAVRQPVLNPQHESQDENPSWSRRK